MPTATFALTVTGDVSASLADTFSVTGGARQSIQESIADSSTDLEVAFVLDVSQAKMFCLLSDQDVTVETNDGTTPGNTFTLEANVPYIWPRVAGQSFVDTEDDAVTTDITALFVTNASGSAATLRVECISDPTV